MTNPTFKLHDFKENERVIMIVRHHWFVLLRNIIGVALLFVLPFFLIPLAFSFAIQSGTVSNIPGGVVVFFSSLWALIMWHILFARWTDYYYDIWVITNLRIIDIDQRGFFHRSVASLLTLDYIQDVETTVTGVIGSLLNFGNIHVQTAAAHVKFLMSEVPNPLAIERAIRSAQEEKIRIFGAHSNPRH